MNSGEAGQVADAITLLETGRVDMALTRLRTLLASSGYPSPAVIRRPGRHG